MSGADHYDCLIIGAGISGIDVAYHLQQFSPWASFLILERRDQEIKNARVALIGSGATSVTLLPNIVDTVEHVTMVQRTPTYISALPRVDRIAEALKRWLPEDTAIWLNRWKNVIFGFLFYQFCTRYGDRAKKFIRNNMKKVVGDSMTE